MDSSATFQRTVQLVKRIYCPILVLFGIVGTSLVLAALWRFKLAPKSTTFLLSALLLNNLIFLVLFMPLIYLAESWKFNVSYTSATVCLLFTHGQTLIPYLQANFQILLSVERCIVVVLPFHAKSLLSLRRIVAGTCVTVLCLIAVSASSYWRAEFVTLANQTYCFSGETYSVAAFYLHLIFWQALPVFFMTVNSIIITTTLCCRRRDAAILRRSSSSASAHRRLTICLVVMTIVYCLFTLPTTVRSIVMGLFSGGVYRSVPMWLQLLRWLTFRNTFVTDWVILLMLSTKIRGGVGRILGFKQRDRRATVTTLANAVTVPD